MSAMTLDVSGTKPVPFTRLTAVELRKMADTKAGLWLLGLIVGITAVFMVIFFFVADSEDRIFSNFIGIASTPQGFLLPVLGILLVTSEWSQRTAMVTFALEPSRARIILAKVVAAVLLGGGAFVAAVVIGMLGTLVGGSDDGFEGLKISVFLLFLALQLLSVLQGVAYGLILLNTPAAIVAFFVLPIASSIVFSLVSGTQRQRTLARPRHGAAAAVRGRHRLRADRRAVRPARHHRAALDPAALRDRLVPGDARRAEVAP